MKPYISYTIGMVQIGNTESGPIGDLNPLPRAEGEKLSFLRAEIEKAGLPYREVIAFPGMPEGYRFADFIVGVDYVLDFIDDPRKHKDPTQSIYKESPWVHAKIGRRFDVDPYKGMTLGDFRAEEVLGVAKGHTALSFETDKEDIFVGAERAQAPMEFNIPVEVPIKGIVRLRPYPKFLVDLLADYEQGFLNGTYKYDTRLHTLRAYFTADQAGSSAESSGYWPQRSHLDSLNGGIPGITPLQRALYLHFPDKLDPNISKKITGRSG